MRKQFWKKRLIGILCVVLFLTNVLSTEIQVFATEAETGRLIVDENLEKEVLDEVGIKSEDGEEKDNTENETKQPDIEQEKAPDGESTERDDEEQEDADSENENDEEQNDTENETEAPEMEQEEDVEDIDDVMLYENTEDRLVLTASTDDIASGIFEGISWVIDGNGKLTVSGNGNFSDSTGMSRAPWYSNRDSIKSAEIDISGITDASYMFYDCKSLTNIDLSNFDTSDVTDMRGMFYNCYKLASLNLSTFNTGNVTDMNSMFDNCRILESLDLSTFNTSNVTNMMYMFFQCNNLTNLNLSRFDTSNVTEMGYMFSQCFKLENLNLSHFITNKVVWMEGMFQNCYDLVNLNMDSFDTSNVQNFNYMFQNCRKLKSLNLSNFNFVSATDIFPHMLEGCSLLNTIYNPYNVNISIVLPKGSNDNWYLSDGTIVTELPKNLNYCVVIMKNKIPTEEEPTKKYSITFDANGGTVETKTIETNVAGKITEFPKAELSGTMFGGWYTEAVFGDRVSTDTVFEEDTTLYARYFTENEIRYKDDMACFLNNISYYLTDADKENYYSNLDYSSRWRIRLAYELTMKNKANGVCFGISSLMIENKTGKFDPSVYGANCFNELSPADNINFTSILTIYQLSQNENSIKNEEKRFSKLSLREKLKEVIERAEEVSTKGPSIFCFRFGSDNEHAIVIDGIEYGDVEVGGNTYYYTIKTYDINLREGRPEYVSGQKEIKISPDSSYIYISKDLDAWTMKNFGYFGGKKQSGTDGKKELLAVYNSDKISVSYSNWEKVELEPMLFINDALGSTYSLNIRGTETVITNGVTVGDIDTGVYTVGQIALEENGFSSATVFLPDDYEGTVLKKEGNDNISIMHASGYDLVNVESAKANELKIGQSVGTMQILGNDGNYHFDLIKENMSVNEINIDGQTEGNISIQYESGGFLLSSTGENCVSISVNGNGQILYKNINEQDIFIKDAGDTVKVFIDEDDDGVCEKEWIGGNNTEEDKENNGSWNNNSTGENSIRDSRIENTNNKWQTSDRIDISGGIEVGTIVDAETWKPTTPDEKKRYACMGKNTIQYTLAKDNAYRLIIENAMQGPLCFDSFEAALGDYTIGRTYNIYPYSDKVYSMGEEVQFTIKIPETIYKPSRKYKMVCVTKGGKPIAYDDLDTNPETITVRTNKFYAYALIYKDMK